jgi:hypothetical protein
MIAVERLAIIWCEGVKISPKNFSLSRIRISSPFAVNITGSRKLVPKLVLKPDRALKHPHRTNSRSTSFPRVALTRVGVKSDTANRETAPHHRRASLSDYFFLRRTKKKKTKDDERRSCRRRNTPRRRAPVRWRFPVKNTLSRHGC